MWGMLQNPISVKYLNGVMVGYKEEVGWKICECMGEESVEV